MSDEPTVPTVEDILMYCRFNVRSNVQYQDFGCVRDYEELSLTTVSTHINTIETLLLALLETLTDDQKIALQNKIIQRGA